MNVMTDIKNKPDVAQPDNAIDPLWYKDAIIYQLHVKTFADQ